jgi:ABC-type sugar transport system ATPase subunit
MENNYVLEMKNIYKNYGNVEALIDVDFSVKHGEIVGLVGSNGAGKSTLMKMIAGNFPPSKGEIFFEGNKVNIHSPHQAQALGIEIVYQDLALCENLDIAGNFFLGREITKGYFQFLQEKEMRKQAFEGLKKIGITTLTLSNITKKVQFLSGGQRQAVAVGKASAWGAKLILLDEPTSALGLRESQSVLELIKSIRKERGASIVIVSHNLQHVLPVADRIVVLQHGKKIYDFDPKDVEYDKIVEMISEVDSIKLDSIKSKTVK